MVDKGIDPRQAKADKRTADEAARKAEERTAARRALTLADAWAVYLAERKPRWSDGHDDNHLNLAAFGGEEKKRGKGAKVAGPLASLMPLSLTALTSDRISTWLAAESAHRATNDKTNAMIQMLLTMLSAVSAFELAMINERRAEGQAKAREAGKHMGRFSKLTDEQKARPSTRSRR